MKYHFSAGENGEKQEGRGVESFSNISPFMKWNYSICVSAKRVDKFICEKLRSDMRFSIPVQWNNIFRVCGQFGFHFSKRARQRWGKRRVEECARCSNKRARSHATKWKQINTKLIEVFHSSIETHNTHHVKLNEFRDFSRFSTTR